MSYPLGASRVALLLMVLLLGACSSTTFFYNRLDFIIGWYISDYVEFNDTQQGVFDRQLDALLAWHRRDELPQYLQLLDDLAVALDSDLTDAQLRGIYGEIEAALGRTQVRINTMALSMAGELAPEQLLGFIDHLDEQQLTREVELLGRDRAAYDDDISERLEDNLGDFLGRLNSDQRQVVRDGVSQLTRLDEAWLGERAHWNQQLRRLFTERDADWLMQLQAALNERSTERSAESRQHYAHNIAITLAIVRDVINQRTPKQDRRLRNRLDELREDIAGLIEANSVVQ